MSWSRVLWLPTFCMIFIIAPIPSVAQSIGGGIIGRAKDQSGAAVPAALIQVINTSTGQTRVVSSDNEGNFEAREVPPGSYSVIIVEGGFNTARISGVVLSVSQVLHLGDIVLSVANSRPYQRAVNTASL